MTSIVESSPAGSLDARFDEVYSQLRRLARGQRASGQDTLNTTALVHELYLQMRNGSAAPQFNAVAPSLIENGTCAPANRTVSTVSLGARAAPE